MMTIGAAGILKILDLEQFEVTLREHWGFPIWARVIIATSLPPFEVALAVLWLAGVRRHLQEFLGLGLLVVLTAAFCWLWLQGRPPQCACFGRIRAYAQMQNDAAWVVVRNGLLVFILTLGMLLRCGSGCNRRQRPGPPAVCGLHISRWGVTA
ncbi:MAG: hypothetical protein KF757_01640 [Phycisphaeraceae bacterium]|nr:hypothetical protein [Phycisphaeraceae bacterium]MCW5761913.1 hypothetical protein [Phycisphaeraceae bacterium]